MTLPLEFAIDVSGSPGDNTFFALVSFNKITKNRIINQLFNEYPEIENKKGRKLKTKQHINVINFLSENKVKMVGFEVTKNDWAYIQSIWGEAPEYIEKIGAIMFYHLIRNIAWKNHSYDVITCIESQFGDIDRVYYHCRRLSNVDRVDLNFSFGRDRYHEGIKIADFIAYSIYALKTSDTRDFRNFHYIKKGVPKRFYREIFK